MCHYCTKLWGIRTMFVWMFSGTLCFAHGDKAWLKKVEVNKINVKTATLNMLKITKQCSMDHQWKYSWLHYSKSLHWKSSFSPPLPNNCSIHKDCQSQFHLSFFTSISYTIGLFVILTVWNESLVHFLISPWKTRLITFLHRKYTDDWIVHPCILSRSFPKNNLWTALHLIIIHIGCIEAIVTLS